MKFGFLCGAASILFLFSSSLRATTPLDYYPPQTFDNFTTQWFTKPFIAVNEPSLYEISRRDHSARIYRLAVYPPFSDAIILRVEEQSNGLGILMLSRVNQSADGPWHRKARFVLSRAGMTHFLELVDKAHFWRLDSELKNGEIIEDGTEFVYEGVRDGRYHLVERFFYSKAVGDAFYAPALFLLKLANEPTDET